MVRGYGHPHSKPLNLSKTSHPNCAPHWPRPTLSDLSIKNSSLLPWLPFRGLVAPRRTIIEPSTKPDSFIDLSYPDKEHSMFSLVL